MISRRINSTMMEILLIRTRVATPIIEDEDYLYLLNEEAKKLATASECIKIKRAALIIYPQLKDPLNPLNIASSGINRPIDGCYEHCHVGKISSKGGSGLVTRCNSSIQADREAINNFWANMMKQKDRDKILKGEKTIYNFKYNFHPKMNDQLELTNVYSLPEYETIETLRKMNVKNGAYKLFGLWYSIDYNRLINSIEKINELLLMEESKKK